MARKNKQVPSATVAGAAAAQRSYTTIAQVAGNFDAQVAFEACQVGAYEEKRSRFLAHLTHVESASEAEAFIAQVRTVHYDARHNVFAWVLSDGSGRQSDDGEPSRTAGMPVLEVLKGAGLADVCCVVTRYFGGTLLGPGGLVRAYGQATHNALERAQAAGGLVLMSEVVRVELTVPYSSYDTVLHLAQAAGAHVVDAAFTSNVQLKLDFLVGQEASFAATLREQFKGSDLCQVFPPRFDAFTQEVLG